MRQERRSEPVHVDSHEQSFSVVSVEGIVQSLSRDILTLTGWNEHDWFGKHFHLFLHKDDVGPMEICFQQVLLGRSVHFGPLRCLTKEGAYMNIEASFVPRIDGSIIDILWLSHTNTHYRLGQEPSQSSAGIKLYRESEGHPQGVEQAGLLAVLQTLLANAPVGIALFDESLKFICLNQTFSQMTGFPPDRLVGQSLLEAMPGVGLLIEPTLRKVLVHGLAVTDHEMPLQRFSPSQNPRWGLFSFYPVPDGGGGICGVAVISVDISDRKRAEKKLRESEDRFRLAVDATKLGTWDMNFKTGESVWSDRTKDIFGLTAEFGIDYERFLAQVHPDDSQRVLEAIEAAKDPRSGGDYQIEFRVSGGKAGIQRWVASRGRVCFDSTGTPLRFVGTSLDITEQKNTEEALRKLSQELTRSNGALDAFAHTASHDLKEPLRTIANFVSLLSSHCKGQLDKNADEYMGFITGSAQNMCHLVDSILEYAKNGRTEIQFAKVNGTVILETALLNLRLAQEESHIKVTSDPMPLVYGSEDLILQIFQNLIGNAIKFRASQNPTVHIGVKLQGESWLFSVADNGIGIRSDFLEAVFSPFRRLHSKYLYAGSGLGLSICKQNVERHGGKIWVTSNEGKGSTFYFTLPAIPEGKTNSDLRN